MSVIGGLSYSSPIIIEGDSAWMTSIGSWRTCERAFNCNGGNENRYYIFHL